MSDVDKNLNKLRIIIKIKGLQDSYPTKEDGLSIL